MKVLLVGLVKAPQVGRLRDEGREDGHIVQGCYPTDLGLRLKGGQVRATLGGDRPLEDFDIFFLWALARHKHEWYVALEAIKKTKPIVVIDGRCLRASPRHQPTPAWEYRLQVEGGMPFPRSAIISSPRSVDAVASSFEFPVVVKGSQSRQGRGVKLARTKKELMEIVREMGQSYPAAVLREFIPNEGDIRVFTVGYKAIGAMLRRAPEGEFRNNISQGATGYPFDLEAHPEVRELAERLSRSMEIEVAGVDVIIHKETGKAYLLEINPGPEIAGIERYTGLNVAKNLLDYFDARLQEEAKGYPALALA